MCEIKFLDVYWVFSYFKTDKTLKQITFKILVAFFRDVFIFGTLKLSTIGRMEKNTATFDTSPESTEWRLIQETAKALAASSHAPSTLKKYEADWLHFSNWCEEAICHSAKISRLPTNDKTLATYVAAHINTTPNSLKSRLAAIRFVHRRAGVASPFECAPMFDAVYRGYKRHWAGRNHRPRQEAATEDRLKKMADVWRDGLMATRNRAVLLLGFDAALRRSELANLEVQHLRWSGKSVCLHLPKSKGDPWGLGAEISVLHRDRSPYCPVCALKSWLHASEIDTGPIFRRLYRTQDGYTVGDTGLSDRSIYTIVRNSAVRAGIEGKFGAHSLRRGFIHSATEKSNAITDVQQRVRHKSLSTTTRYLGSRKGQSANFRLLDR